MGARGNGTCMLGQNITQNITTFTADTNYDVYAKGRVSLLGCRTGQNISPNLSQSVFKSQNDGKAAPTLTINNKNAGRIFGNSNWENTFGNSFFTKKINQSNSILPFRETPTSKNDAETRILDILQNKRTNNYKHSNPFKINAMNHPSLHQDDFESYYSNNFKVPKIKEKKSSELFFGQKIIHPLKDFETFSLQKEFDDKNYPTALEFFSDFGQKIIDPSNSEFTSHDDFWLNSG